MKTRMPKQSDTVRAHVQMPPEWRVIIDAAAAKSSMSRSSYISHTAYTAAKAEVALGEQPAKERQPAEPLGLLTDMESYDLMQRGLRDGREGVPD